MNEAELLFSEILGRGRSSLYLDKGLVVNRPALRAAAGVLKRRMSGQPLQYILGKTEFMGLEFKVTPEALIPRPETEILVETVIKVAQSSKLKAQSLRILDLGTGSGCIAVSLAKFLTGIIIHACDISDKALRVAKMNARLNEVKIDFIKSDLFGCSELKNAAYDIIVSNPPYIPSSEIKNLQPELRYEPAVALDGGEDGYGFYRRIIPDSCPRLRGGGYLVMEIGYNQAKPVKDILNDSGNFTIIDVIKDYAGIDRVIVAQKIELKTQNLELKTKT